MVDEINKEAKYSSNYPYFNGKLRPAKIPIQEGNKK